MKYLCSLMLLLLLSPVAKGCSLIVRVADVPPFYSQNANGEWEGLAVDLSRAILKEAGCTAQYRAIPWRRALHQMEMGSVAAMMNVSKTPERERTMYFVGPVLEERMVLVLAADNPIEIGSYSDFKALDKPVGLLRGGFYGEAFKAAVTLDTALSDKFYLANTTANNQQNLVNKRLSGFITQEFSAYYRLKKIGEGFRVHPWVFHRNDVYMGLSKKGVTAEQYQAFQAATEKLRANGELARLLSQYKGD
ncbi:MAG: substrate-binding periplasmic protein [Pseudomonadales bacterium]